MIKIDVTTDTLSKKLTEARQALDDLTPLLQEIGLLMVYRTEENFRSGRSPDGTPWAPRSQTTLDAYAARGQRPRGGPLQGPSPLESSLQTSFSHEATADHVDWGSSALQAAVMQLGARQGQFGARIGKDKNGRDFFMTIPWGDIPARPYLGVGPEDETAILETIGEYLGGLIGD